MNPGKPPRILNERQFSAVYAIGDPIDSRDCAAEPPVEQPHLSEQIGGFGVTLILRMGHPRDNFR